MSFDELTAIAKEHHERQAYALHTIKMNSALRALLREKYNVPHPFDHGAPSSTFTEAFEMSAAKHGLPFMGNLGYLTGIRLWIDDSLPENTWRLEDAQGKVVKEGVVSEGNE